VRSTVSALTSANQQLGTVQGLLSTTQSALNNVSNTMTKMRDVLVKLSDSDVSGTQRSQYQAQYTSLLANVNTFIQDAGYNGKTLIGNITGSSGTYGRVTTVRNESGASYGIASFSGASLITAITIDFTTVTTAAAVSALISATGTFIQQMDNVGDGLNMVGSEVNYVNNQISYNSNKVDALNTGLGSLVDADLAKESAALQALQIRQQLGTQALSMANQAPQTLLSLFK
jgi:flagellin